MATFREDMERIIAIASGVQCCEEELETDLCQINTTLACNRCLVNQACEAVVRMGERMKLVDRTKYFFPFLAQEVALNQRAECQAHIAKETEG